MKYQCFLLLFFPLIVISQRQEVHDLYGKPYDTKIYSGYLDTGVDNKKHFYVFVESEETSSNVLYVALYGGPGCSILENFLTGSGPMLSRVPSGTSEQKWIFEENKFSWNKNVHVLYLESPAGVGFSKTDDQAHTYTDEETSKANYASLVHFFDLFPEHKDNDLYIGGESYAGIYVPNLLKQIYSESEPKLNPKGIFIGNAVVDKETDIERSLIDFGLTNGLLSLELKEEYNAVCPKIDIPFANMFFPREVTTQCNDVRKKIRGCFEGLDLYGIYNTCKPYSLSENKTPPMTLKQVMTQTMNKMNEELKQEETLWPNYCAIENTSYLDFLASNENRDKLHVDSTVPVWEPCNMEIMGNYQVSDSIAIFHEIIMQKNIKVWFYSGDADGVVPTIGSIKWLKKTGWKIKEDNKPWWYDGQIAGLYRIYENGFTFITVKGAGHITNWEKGPQMKWLFDAFIKGIIE